MIIIYLILIATFIYAVANKSRRTLHMLQQNLYNENNRYLKWVFNNKRQFLCLDIILICISLIGIFVVFDLSFVSTLSMILIALFLILIGYTWDKKIKNDQNKKKLVIKSKCKDSCCCKNCDCIVGYDEKSDDDDSVDISVNEDSITIS